MKEFKKGEKILIEMEVVWDDNHSLKVKTPTGEEWFISQKDQKYLRQKYSEKQTEKKSDTKTDYDFINPNHYKKFSYEVI